MRQLSVLLIAVCVSACTTVRVYPAAPMPAAQRDDALVQAGDSLYGIARRNGLTVRELAQANGLQEPYLIHPGQHLRIPQRAASSVAVARATDAPTVRIEPLDDGAPAARALVSKPPVAKIAPAGPVVARTAVAKSAAANAAVAPVATKTASQPKAAAPQWRWPAEGALLNLPARRDAVVQSLDIAGSAGSPVRAAAAGKVVYSGDGSPGHERLIVLEHESGWLSSYSHNRKRWVTEGQRVQAGDVIAEMGSVGATRDMLHFELRHQGRLVDPRSVLPPR